TQTLLFTIHDVGFNNRNARIDTIVTGDDTRTYNANIVTTYPLPVSYSLQFTPDSLANWLSLTDTSFVLNTSTPNAFDITTSILNRGVTKLSGWVYMINDSTQFVVDSVNVDFTLRKLKEFIAIDLNPDTLLVNVGNDDISHQRDFNITNNSYLTANPLKVTINSVVVGWITTSNPTITLNSGQTTNFNMIFDVLNMQQSERNGTIVITDETFGLDTVAVYTYSFTKFLRGAIVFKASTNTSLSGQTLTHSGFTFDWTKTSGTSASLLSSIRLEHFKNGLVDSVKLFEQINDSTFEVLNLDNGNYRLSVVLQDNLVPELYGVGDTLLFAIDGAKVTLEENGYWSLISPVTDTKETVSKLIQGTTATYYSWNNSLNDNFGAYEAVNSTTINPNKAYWVKLSSGNTIRSMIYDNSKAVDTAFASTQSTLALAAGWHLIGSPWNHNIILGNQLVKVNGQFVSLLSTTARENLNTQVWEYIRLDSILTYSELLDPTTALEAKRGYWFYTSAATEIKFTPQQTLDASILAKSKNDWSADLQVETENYNDYLNFSVNTDLSKQIFGKKPPKITSTQNFSVRINDYYSSVKIPNVKKKEYERYEMSIVGKKGQQLTLNLKEREEQQGKRFIFVQQIATGKVFKMNDKSELHSIRLAAKTDIFLVYISEDPNFVVPYVPTKFALHQNYPNPFNPSTTVQFDLPYGKIAYDVTVQVYNLLGQKIKTLFKGKLEAGQRYRYVWEGKNEHGRNVSSGMYFYRVIAGSFIESKKMVLIK
ncbi:MAG: T9SS type A sorting domain-containing protein, partial [Calditrichaeota bacterium]|nr:T9SS type A sorting domain-containing protein [Calditrichota bacterium]